MPELAYGTVLETVYLWVRVPPFAPIGGNAGVESVESAMSKSLLPAASNENIMSADNAIFIKSVGDYFYVREGGMTQKMEGQIDDSYMTYGRGFMQWTAALAYAAELESQGTEYDICTITE